VPEAAGFADVATTLFETALVVISVLLLARPRQRARGSSVAWALPLVIAPLTILAVLSAVGAIGFLPETG
jgi:hypothetical protein